MPHEEDNTVGDGADRTTDDEVNPTTDHGVTRLYGEPFDSGFAQAERLHLAADLAAAVAVYEELLTLAESVEDSPTCGSCGRICWRT